MRKKALAKISIAASLAARNSYYDYYQKKAIYVKQIYYAAWVLREGLGLDKETNMGAMTSLKRGLVCCISDSQQRQLDLKVLHQCQGKSPLSVLSER